MPSGIKARFDRFERFAVDVVYDRRTGRAARVFGMVLNAFSYLFEGIVRLRWYLYRNRLLRNRPLGCLVIVVGNLTVGGTEKPRWWRNLPEVCTSKVAKWRFSVAAIKVKKSPFTENCGAR